MIRLVGYCKRCKAIGMNWQKYIWNEDLEPNMYLNKHRNHPQLGSLFGTYNQYEQITSKADFYELFKGQIKWPHKEDKL